MTIWAEAHDLPHLVNAGKKIAWLPLLDYRFGKHADAFREEASFTIPSSWNRIGQLHHVDPDDHSNDVGSVVHFFQRGVLGGDNKPVPVGSYVVERRPDDLTSQGTSTTSFSGRGLTSYFLDRMKLLPFDYPKQPTAQPDWKFGAPDGGGLLSDWSFENIGFPNGGFEDGNADHWSFDGGGLAAVLDPIQARSGDYYGLWSTVEEGRLRVSLTALTIGAEYTVRGYFDDLTGTGERIRMGVSGASSSSHVNDYFDEDEKIRWAEIGNVEEGNGSTTGSYVETTLIFVAGETAVEIIVEYLGTNSHFIAIDDFVISGATVGLGAWRVASNPGELDVAEISTEQAHTGSRSLKMQGSQPAYIDGFGRISYVALRAFQDVAIIPGRIYSSTVWVYNEGPDPEFFVARMTRLTPQGPLGQTLGGGFLPAPGSYDMAAKYVEVPPDTWTPISLTSIADTTEIRYSIAWAGAVRPTTNLGVLTSPVFYIDTASFYEGLPSVTIGEVWRLIQGDRLDWLIPTFTDADDSNGDPWDSTRAFTLSEGDSWGQIAEAFQRLWQYVHRIRYDREDNAYYFDIFNPGYVELDHSTTDSGSLTVGMNILGGEAVSRAPDATRFRITSEGGFWAEDEDDDLLAAWGEADFFLEAPDVANANDLTDAMIVAQARNLDEMITFEAEMGSVPQVRPFEHINVFHRVQVNLGGKSAIPTGDRIVTSIVCAGKPGAMPRYQVHVNSDAFASTGAAALVEAVRRLLRRRLRFPDQPSGIGTGEGKGGVPRLVVAASNASAESKAKADIVCAGNDREVFASVASMFSDDIGGELRLTEGQFIPNVAITWENTYITGAGMGVTSIILTANWTFNGDWGFRDFNFVLIGG